MAIAPIDLQTLFTQVEKVGKTQAAQKEGQALHQSIVNTQLQKKVEEQINQVNETQNTGEGAEKVKDRDHDQDSRNPDSRKREKEDSHDEPERPSVLSDPSLGKNIDISF